MKILHFATCKCPVSRPILVLMFEYIIGGCMASCVRKFYSDELKVPNFRPFFSLNDFWVMQGSNPLASKKILHLVISPLEAKNNAIFKLNFSNLVYIPFVNILLKIHYSFPTKYWLLSCLLLPPVLMRLPGLIIFAN